MVESRIKAKIFLTSSLCQSAIKLMHTIAKLDLGRHFAGNVKNGKLLQLSIYLLFAVFFLGQVLRETRAELLCYVEVAWQWSSKPAR